MTLGTAIDRMIAFAAPGWAGKRATARISFELKTRALEAGVQDRLSGRLRRQESIVQATRRSLARTREQARDLYRYNPHAHRLVDSTVAYVIGCGIRPQARVVKPRLLKPQESFNDKADTAWERWAKEENFYGKQRMVLREKVVAGECLVRMSRPTGREIQLALEVIKSERLALLDQDAGNSANGNQIIQGIEVNPAGRVVAYHIHRRDPTESSVSYADQPERVAAEEILHIFDPLEPGQMRGLTRFLPVAGTIEGLAQYQDYILTKERIAACFALAVVRNNVGISEIGIANGTSEEDEEGNQLAQLEGGMFYDARPGEQLQGVSSGVQPAAVDQLTGVLQRQIAAGFNSSYELLSGDLSKVSYLSARQGENQNRRHWEPEQDAFNHGFNLPIWRAFIKAGATSGAFRVEPENLEAYSAVEFVTDGWDWIEPSKDIEALEAAIKAGLMSPQEATARSGRNWFQIMTEAAAHKREMAALGLTYTIYPDVMAKAEAEAKPAPEPMAPSQERETNEEAPEEEADAA